MTEQLSLNLCAHEWSLEATTSHSVDTSWAAGMKLGLDIQPCRGLNTDHYRCARCGMTRQEHYTWTVKGGHIDKHGTPDSA